MIETEQHRHRRRERTIKTIGGIWLRAAAMTFAVLALTASCVVSAAAAHSTGL